MLRDLCPFCAPPSVRRLSRYAVDVMDEYDIGTYFSGGRRLRSGLIGTARGALDGYAEAQAVQSWNITFLSSYVVSWCSLCCRVIWVHSFCHTDTPDSHIRTRFGVDGLSDPEGVDEECRRRKWHEDASVASHIGASLWLNTIFNLSYFWGVICLVNSFLLNV